MGNIINKKQKNKLGWYKLWGENHNLLD